MGQEAGEAGPGRVSDAPPVQMLGTILIAGVSAPHIQFRTSICIIDSYQLLESHF